MKIGYLDTVMRVKTGEHNSKIDKAAEKTRRYAREADKAKDKSKGMAGGIDRAANAAAVLHGPLGGVAGRLSSISSGFKSVGVAATVAGVALAGAGTVFSKGLSEFADSERQLLRAEALLKSTGYASGLTVQQLDDQARSIAYATLANTQDIRDAQAVLKTFKAVSLQTFTEAIELSQDMASVMGSDAKSAVLQLGKALEDPSRGLTALTRSGVSFTEVEKEKIKTLQESGRVLEAQGVLLEKVAGQFGGAAVREAQSLSGSVDTLGQSFSEFAEALVKATNAGEKSRGILDLLSDGFKGFKEDLDPTPVREYNELLVEREELLQRIGSHSGRRASASLERRLVGVTKRLGELREAEDKRIEQMKVAQRKSEQQRKAMAAQVDEAKRLKELEEDRVKLQKESIRLAQSRTSKADSLYQKLFKNEKGEPKEYKRNFAFEADAKSAKSALDDGLGGAAKHFIDQAEAGYRAAKNYGSGLNYDLQGMKDVVIALREAAGLDFQDPDRKRRSGGSESSGKSIVELTRENGDQLKLVADTNKEMSEKVAQYLDSQTSILKQVNSQNQPSKKFVLELSVPGKNKNFSVTAESKEDFESGMASLLEGAAAGI